MSTTEITLKDLHDLLDIFEKKSFEAGLCEDGSVEHTITTKCENLFKLDYSLIELDNVNGNLCPRYPGRIFIPEYERGHNKTSKTATSAATTSASNSCCNNSHSSTSTTNGIHTYVTFANVLDNNQINQQQQQQQHQIQQQSTIYEDLYDAGRIRELITSAKYARCRQRFVVPVIMYKGKYICRSATLSLMSETYGRKMVDYAYDCLNGTNNVASNMDEENNDPTDDSLMNGVNSTSGFSYDEAIKNDIQLLKALNVTTITDLMVENRKIKYFMAVSSSEKADPDNHYKDFNILSLPYPGCEFFKDFRDNNYMASNLYYNWNQSFIDATISVPKLGNIFDLNIPWREYKKWDLVLITQNYLKANLKYMQNGSAGLLMHCISGWDRTPLFISLVRLSLWADGLIHQSLNAIQMAFFTVAYDWYLFGHQLPDRLNRGEDIMFFCFHVLKYITDDEFSITELRKRTKTSSNSSVSSTSVATKSDSCDDEHIKEEYVLNIEEDSNDNDSCSNLSNCDMSITDNSNATTNNITSRSPNPKRSKTSPISVPGANGSRQRHESTSSTGSWQVVNEMGSLDSVANGVGVNAKEVPGAKSPSTLRKQRLNSVRAIFIQTYGKTIGLRFQEGSSMNLVTFIGTLTDQLF